MEGNTCQAPGDGRASYIVFDLGYDKIVGIVPLVVAVAIMLVELFVVFIPAIEQRAIVLGEAYIQLQITYGLIFSLTLAFISNSLKVGLNRRYCNPLGTAAAVFACLFIVSSIYTWIWSNGGSLVGWFCKNFLSMAEVRVSASTIQIYAYNALEKYIFDMIITWALAFQSFVVVVDCLLSTFRKGQARQMGLYVKTVGCGWTKRITCCLDSEYL